jgi:hypothetical protein
VCGRGVCVGGGGCAVTTYAYTKVDSWAVGFAGGWSAATIQTQCRTKRICDTCRPMSESHVKAMESPRDHAAVLAQLFTQIGFELKQLKVRSVLRVYEDWGLECFADLAV